jgi:hypothetical protein
MNLERRAIVKYVHFKGMRQTDIHQELMLVFGEEANTFALVKD